MVGLKSIISLVITIVIAIVLIPAIWDAIWTESLGCREWNSSPSQCSASVEATCCLNKEVNSSTETLLKLVPLVFVGAIIIAAVVLGYTKI